MKFKIALILGVVLSVASLSFAEVVTGNAAPDFSLVASDGQTYSLSDFKGSYVVLEWVNYECPFVKKHYSVGNMQKLQKEFTAKDVVWLSINSSAPGKQGFYSNDEINQIMKNADAAPSAYLVDSTGEVGRLYGAKTTPHMFVIDPEGQLIYQGAIDSNPSFDSADIADAENYVVAALNAAMLGESVVKGTTQSYGCSVKY